MGYEENKTLPNYAISDLHLKKEKKNQGNFEIMILTRRIFP